MWIDENRFYFTEKTGNLYNKQTVKQPVPHSEFAGHQISFMIKPLKKTTKTFTVVSKVVHPPLTQPFEHPFDYKGLSNINDKLIYKTN